jgi:uncharacterized protein (DUF433 family)
MTFGHVNASLLNAGIYSVAEAARLSRVSPPRIRRWLKGYEFKTKRDRHHSAPVWSGQFKPIDGKQAVGFRDLIEIRFVAAFIEAGVSWKTMRAAHRAAQVKLQSEHPFCTNSFVTDGRAILFHEAQAVGDAVLLDLTTHQLEFEKIVTPFLKELEFADPCTLVRWWPLGRGRAVVVDPERNFGQPSALQTGVPTSVLMRSVKANGGSIEQVARWYEIQPREVEDALEFEQRFAA